MPQVGLLKQYNTIYVVYTLQVQDGANRRTVHIPTEIYFTEDNDIINAEGESILEEEFTGQRDGEWCWDEFGQNAGRYYSYEIIPNKETFDLISKILAK